VHFMFLTDLDGEQPVVFYYLDPGRWTPASPPKRPFERFQSGRDMHWNGMLVHPNLRTNSITSMNVRNPQAGPILVRAHSAVLMVALPFKDFNDLLAMLLHSRFLCRQGRLNKTLYPLSNILCVNQCTSVTYSAFVSYCTSSS
jgi:hypothetical protein